MEEVQTALPESFLKKKISESNLINKIAALIAAIFYEDEGRKKMRLRNIPRAREVLDVHEMVIKDEKKWRGRWSEVFGNDNPVYIEIGMGKGQFIITLAKQNPDINYKSKNRRVSYGCM